MSALQANSQQRLTKNVVVETFEGICWHEVFARAYSSQNQFAQTIAAFPGVKFVNGRPTGEPVQQVLPGAEKGGNK